MEHQEHAEHAERVERVEHAEHVERPGMRRSAVKRRGAPRSTMEPVKNLKYEECVEYMECIGVPVRGRRCDPLAPPPDLKMPYFPDSLFN